MTMSMGINNNEIHGLDWGAAFRDKPIMLKSHAEVSAFLQGRITKNMALHEDTFTLSTNDNYRNQNTLYEIPNSEKGSAFLDFGFLIRDESSCLKGSLSDAQDADFYNFHIPIIRSFQNDYDIEVNIDLPEGSNYNLTLYDEYGNQVGKAEWNGDNRKSLKIPNWDTSTNKYSIKIENESGEEVAPDDYYKISFHVSKSEEHEKTDAITEAYGAWQIAKSRNLPEQQEYLDRYNELLQEAETNYTKEVEQLHQKQYESLPAEKRYKGNSSVEELLQDMANGRELNESELTYVKIFSNLKDYEKAQQKAELKNDFSTEFASELENAGISQEDVEGMQVKIASNGTVTVEGIENEAVKKQVENLVEEKYGDRLYQYYIGISDSVGNLSNHTYEYATDVQEVKRQLKAMTGEDISLEDLYIIPMSGGKIGGLPDKAANIINNTKNNAKIERLKDSINDIIGNISQNGDSIPEFTSEFQFQNGEFSVVDSGFHIDMSALEKKMNSEYYGSSYQYKFQEIL